MEALSDRLRAYYGMSLEDYERFKEPPSFQNVPTIENDLNVQKTIKRLKLAKEKGEKVLVYGDYDTDGVMSASIMVRLLKGDGIEVDGYLPSRYLDGYGLTKENVVKIAKNGFSLIVTTDNGVTAFDAIDEAKKLGLDVIIMDHHEFGLHDPNADIIIHPDRLNYGDVPISAGMLCFLFSVAYLNKIDPYLLSLGATSTISDSMPIKKYNREMVRLLLQYVNQYHYPEFMMLSKSKTLDMDEFKFTIIPKINAVGRVEKGTSINRLLHYFADEGTIGKGKVASIMDEINEERKALTNEALATIKFNSDESSVVVVTDLLEGLNGLLASRLLQSEKKPIAVFSPKENDSSILVGSLRSQEGFDILEAFKATGVELISHGGHAFAGGCSIKKSDFLPFKKDFNFFALKHPLKSKEKKLVELNLSECTLSSYEILQSFSPFGFGHEEPHFVLHNLDTNTFCYARDGRYLSTALRSDVRLFSFSLGKEDFKNYSQVDLEVSFSLNNYRGKTGLDVLVGEIL